MENKEKIYDDLIAKPMQQIIETCKEHGIGLFANFQYSNDGFCKSLIKTNENHSVLTVQAALAECAEEGGVNIDKFILWVMKEMPNKSSMILALLNKMPENNPASAVKEKPAPQLYQVWKNIYTKRKFVVFKNQLNEILVEPEHYEFVCSEPHGDGDFSYMCNGSHCRCQD
jgi:hypothetical protein